MGGYYVFICVQSEGNYDHYENGDNLTHEVAWNLLIRPLFFTTNYIKTTSIIFEYGAKISYVKPTNFIKIKTYFFLMRKN